ncbi:pitrilysin family protein [Lactococcus formosensis subsp. formosensis]|uniref:EF-P 5-aminopentanol modification-associated protein YfmH n=1 Tax=Lactococcus formosensis TaxID=1281486 RepID=UPI003133432E
MQKKSYEKTGEVLYTDVLDNGLTVYYLPKPDYNRTYGLFTTNFGSLDTSFIPTGSRDMKTFPEGIAHFLEHKLFEKKEGDVMYKFGAYGAQTNAFTSFSRTSYLFSTRENIYECVNLLLDFVQEPYFTEENVAKEQGIIQQEIQMYQDDSDWRLFAGLLASLYPDSPLADDIAGTPHSIKEITAADLYANYETFYHPSNMNLFLTGPFDVEQMAAFVNDNQETKPFIKAEPIQRKTVEGSQPIAGKTLAFEVAMPKLALGFRGEDTLPTDARELLEYKLSNQLLLDMLFGKTSHRYEEMYNAGLVDDSFGYGFDMDKSFHFANITVDTEKPDQVSKVLQEALKSYKIDKDFEKENLEMLKREILGDYYKSLNSLEYLANQFSSNIYGEINFFDLPEILSGLTLEKVSKYAEKFVENMQTVDFIIYPK